MALDCDYTTGSGRHSLTPLSVQQQGADESKKALNRTTDSCEKVVDNKLLYNAVFKGARVFWFLLVQNG